MPEGKVFWYVRVQDNRPPGAALSAPSWGLWRQSDPEILYVPDGDEVRPWGTGHRTARPGAYGQEAVFVLE